MIESGTIITPDMEPDWLAERRKSLGASEAAAALGVSPYDAPIDLWQEKLGLRGAKVESKEMKWGKIHEPAIIAEYERVMGVEVKLRQPFVRHAEFPWITATLDGVVADAGRILEVKTASVYADGWGEAGTNQIPEHYLIQVQHQLAVMPGFEGADVAALIGGNDFRVYHVERNETLIEQIILGEQVFWQHVKDGIPPGYGKMDSRVLALLNPECAGSVELEPGTALLIDYYEELRGRMRRDEEECERMKADILTSLGNAQHGNVMGLPRVKRYRREEAARTQVTKAHVKHYFQIVNAKETS